MKTIGLLGGTAWSSTIGYYALLNQLVSERLGGYHSAKILLKSIDYHDIRVHYDTQDHERIAVLLRKELQGLIHYNPDCIIICCNTLHKYYDTIKHTLDSDIPVMHAIQLVAHHLKNNSQEKVLLLATKLTMEDGFFAKVLEEQGIQVFIPTLEEREKMQSIHSELMCNVVTQASKDYFTHLIEKHPHLDAVVLGCTEYPLVVNKNNSVLPVVDPVYLQVLAAVNYVI